jgi:hypothetical protein
MGRESDRWRFTCSLRFCLQEHHVCWGFCLGPVVLDDGKECIARMFLCVSVCECVYVGNCV